MDLYNEKLIAGNRFEIKKVILNSDDLGIYICTDTESSDNKLYTVNVYKSEKYISKASAICKDLSSDEHNDFYGMFRHEFGLFVVFNYYNGIEIRKYISNNNPEIIERLILGDEVIKRAVEINSYPILIRVTAMQLKNVVVMNDNTIGANYFLDFDNIIELITDTKYISSAGNVLYEVFADSKNCPNQIDAFIVKAAFGRYDSLDKLALEYSAIKSEILDFFEGDDQSDSNILKKDTPKQKKTFLHRDKSHIDPVSPAIDKTDSPNDTKNIYVKNEKIVQEPVHDKVIKKSFIHDMLEKKMSEQKEEKTPEKVQEIKKVEVNPHESEIPKLKNPHVKTNKAKANKASSELAKNPALKPIQKQENTSKPVSVKNTPQKPSVSGRRQVRFPIKTVALFLSISIIMLVIAYGLNSIFPFINDNRAIEADNQFHDSNNSHIIPVEGVNNNKIDIPSTTQPAQTSVTPSQTGTTPVQTVTETTGTTQSPSETTSGPSGNKPSAAIEYTVKAGDYLRKISESFYGTGDYYYVIVDYNKLSGTELTIGQKLLIPPLVSESGVEYELYTVKEGDSLIGIAGKLYNDRNLYIAIKAFNNIGDDQPIVIGQILKIPLDPHYND